MFLAVQAASIIMRRFELKNHFPVLIYSWVCVLGCRKSGRDADRNVWKSPSAILLVSCSLCPSPTSQLRRCWLIWDVSEFCYVPLCSLVEILNRFGYRTASILRVFFEALSSSITPVQIFPTARRHIPEYSCINNLHSSYCLRKLPVFIVRRNRTYKCAVWAPVSRKLTTSPLRRNCQLIFIDFKVGGT